MYRFSDHQVRISCCRRISQWCIVVNTVSFHDYGSDTQHCSWPVFFWLAICSWPSVCIHPAIIRPQSVSACRFHLLDHSQPHKLLQADIIFLLTTNHPGLIKQNPGLLVTDGKICQMICTKWTPYQNGALTALTCWSIHNYPLSITYQHAEARGWVWPIMGVGESGI